jgi:acyl-CoA synthetase (NDP forming)
VVIGGEASNLAEKVCQKYRLNNFKFPAILIRALDLMNRQLIDAERNDDKIGNDLKVKKQNNVQSKLLSYEDSEKISKEFGLNTLLAKYPSNNVELRAMIEQIKLPIVMKVDSPNIIHKNEKNGVVIGLDTIEKAETEFERFQKDFLGEKILIQHQVETGLEIILGLKRDESFGLVLVIGLGGITTEILDEKILFVGDVNKESIKNKLAKSKLIKIFKKEKLNEETLIDQAEKLFELGRTKTEIKEVDVNPMFFYKNQEPVIVDFKIIV